ncbi:MAG: glycine--tRNA ligase, partial [Patescibacteria group bacterium]
PKVWVAAGHVETFHDPLIEDAKTKKRYRLDHLLEDAGLSPEGMSIEQMVAIIKEKGIKSPDGNEFGAATQFNLMFKTQVGPASEVDEAGNPTNEVYLRPETAQGMFTNFKNVVDSFSPDLPFGLAQVGKSFRNEISPRDFIFRVRELEIMEFEYFIDPANWEAEFEKCLQLSREWFAACGLPAEKIHEREIGDSDRAHYSKRTLDFEFAYPFGIKEIGGLAYRTDFDLANHERETGKKLRFIPKDGGAPFVPHVIEPTFGLDRHVLAVLANAYCEDEMNGEKRIFLKLPKHLAPIKAAVSPLLKNKPELVAKAKEVYDMLQKELGMVTWDDNSNVGKRYRRSDEIGVPVHITVDFDSLNDNQVTVRDRDTSEQRRVSVERLLEELL